MLAVRFVVGCVKFYASILTPWTTPDLPEPIDWTDGNP